MLSLQPRSTLSARSLLVTGRAHLDADGGAYLILLVGSDRKRDDERDCGNHEQIPSGRGEIARCLNHPSDDERSCATEESERDVVANRHGAVPQTGRK